MKTIIKNSLTIFLLSVSLLHGMEQEPTRKSPKLVINFLLNPSPIVARDATHAQRLFKYHIIEKIVFVDESTKHRCPLCGFWESHNHSLKKHLKEAHTPLLKNR